MKTFWYHNITIKYKRDDSKHAPSQWETLLQSNTISHWLCANLESALFMNIGDWILQTRHVSGLTPKMYSTAQESSPWLVISWVIVVRRWWCIYPYPSRFLHWLCGNHTRLPECQWSNPGGYRWRPWSGLDICTSRGWRLWNTHDCEAAQVVIAIMYFL